MPRRARLDVPGTLYHVMGREIDGTNIFRDEEDRKAFVDQVKEADQKVVRQIRTRREARRELCFYLYRELGTPMAEIARQVEVGTTGVAIALKEINTKR